MGRVSLLLSVVFCAVVPAFSGEHSLFYTYTALSKPLNLPGIYEFTAVGMLDDRELDYYSSKTQVKEPKQHWMREKMNRTYWEKGTESRKSKEQWFKVNVEILIDRMRHNKSDLHVLQWRHGCEIEESEDGNIKFLKGVDEYSYDGAEFLSFDGVNSRWIAPMQAAEATKSKWDGVTILNQYTKGYLEKECVDWLTRFMEYGKETLKKHSPPVVRLFAKKSVSNPGKLTLTCLATGFYPKDIDMYLRKLRTTLPEHLVTSSGVRPNGDGTYQLRKSVEILEKDKPLFDCFVNHNALQKPIIFPDPERPNGPEEIPCLDCTEETGQGGIIGAVVGVLVTLAVVAGIIFILIKKGIINSPCRGGAEYEPTSNNSPASSSSDVPSAEKEPLRDVSGSAPGPAPDDTDDVYANGHMDGAANGFNGAA